MFGVNSCKGGAGNPLQTRRGRGEGRREEEGWRRRKEKKKQDTRLKSNNANTEGGGNKLKDK